MGSCCRIPAAMMPTFFAVPGPAMNQAIGQSAAAPQFGIGTPETALAGAVGHHVAGAPLTICARRNPTIVLRTDDFMSDDGRHERPNLLRRFGHMPDAIDYAFAMYRNTPDIEYGIFDADWNRQKYGVFQGDERSVVGTGESEHHFHPRGHTSLISGFDFFVRAFLYINSVFAFGSPDGELKRDNATIHTMLTRATGVFEFVEWDEGDEMPSHRRRSLIFLLPVSQTYGGYRVDSAGEPHWVDPIIGLGEKILPLADLDNVADTGVPLIAKGQAIKFDRRTERFLLKFPGITVLHDEPYSSCIQDGSNFEIDRLTDERGTTVAFSRETLVQLEQLFQSMDDRIVLLSGLRQRHGRP